MAVSRPEIFGAASAATCLSVWSDAVDQSCAGTGDPSILPLSLPCGSSTLNTGTTVLSRPSAVAINRQSVRLPASANAGTSSSCNPVARSVAYALLSASVSRALVGTGTTRRGVGGCDNTLPSAPGLPRKGSGRSPQDE